MAEWANEEYGVPAVRDGIPQDPNNHNGPKPGDASGLAEERAARVARAAEDSEPETPEKPGVRGRKVTDKPETR